ncbi:hypothetical protein BWI17_12205 [Betaproteobacteria bacterium GR16-43]|nr:hypothetical protein BWI17_12205 [Betaproteobacteria bacterium GR16-43]
MSNDDAQRDLEQKALRNVRSLVDKIEAEDSQGSRKQVVAVIAIVALVAIVGVGIIVSRGKSADRPSKTAIEIPPPKLPGTPK